MILKFEEITTRDLINIIASAEADGYRGVGFNPGNELTVFASCLVNEHGEKSVDSVECIINYGCKESKVIAINFSYERRKAWGHIVHNGEDPQYFLRWINEEERAGRMEEIALDEIASWLNGN